MLLFFSFLFPCRDAGLPLLLAFALLLGATHLLLRAKSDASGGSRGNLIGPWAAAGEKQKKKKKKKKKKKRKKKIKSRLGEKGRSKTFFFSYFQSKLTSTPFSYWIILNNNRT